MYVQDNEVSKKWNLLVWKQVWYPSIPKLCLLSFSLPVCGIDLRMCNTLNSFSSLNCLQLLIFHGSSFQASSVLCVLLHELSYLNYSHCRCNLFRMFLTLLFFYVFAVPIEGFSLVIMCSPAFALSSFPVIYRMIL